MSGADVSFSVVRWRALAWSTAGKLLLVYATLYLPMDALLGRPRYGLGEFVALSVVWSVLTLLGLPREKAGARPKRRPRWWTVVLMYAFLVVIPASSLGYGLVWLPHDAVYGTALFVNAALASVLLIFLFITTLQRRRQGQFR